MRSLGDDDDIGVVFAVGVSDEVLEPAEVGFDRAESQSGLDGGNGDGASHAAATAVTLTTWMLPLCCRARTTDGNRAKVSTPDHDITTFGLRRHAHGAGAQDQIVGIQVPCRHCGTHS